MSGGAYEYVMGFYGTEGNPTVESTGFSAFSDRKYYDLYTSTDPDSTNIGDALFETRGWNNDDCCFVTLENPMLGRGGDCTHFSSNGLFRYKVFTGAARATCSFRICLAVK